MEQATTTAAPRWRRFAPLLLLLAALGLFVALGGHRLIGLDALRDNYAALRAFTDANPLLAALAATRRVLLDRLLLAIPVVAFDDAAATVYGRILRVTGYSRRKVVDRMIAATAIVNDATLVTMNGADFADVPGLKLEAWG